MTVVLTGITGLVGSHVAMALLAAGHSVAAVARRRDADSADRRVVRLLESAPRYRRDFTLAGLHVMEGDVLRPMCGIDAATQKILCGTVDAIVHCAGDVTFRPGADTNALRVNVRGVTRVVALARALDCRRVVHVGTAYAIPGRRSEDYRTAYEASKAAGEREARRLAESEGLDLRIVRPSIVTGDSASGFTPTYHGIYPFLRYGAQHVHALRKLAPDKRLPDGFVAGGRVNLVPAEWVAEVIREVACRPAPGGHAFNAVNPTPWRASELVDILGDYLGLDDQGIGSSADTRLPDAAQSTGHMLAEAYAPYFDADPAADAGTLAQLMRNAGIPPLTNRREWIVALMDWGVRHEWSELA